MTVPIDEGPEHMRLLTAYGYAGYGDLLADRPLEEQEALRRRVLDAGVIARLSREDRKLIRDAMAVAFAGSRVGSDLSWAEEEAFLDEFGDDTDDAPAESKGVDFDEPDDAPDGALPAADDAGWVGV